MYPDYLEERFWTRVAICAHGFSCAQCCWPWEGHLVKEYGYFPLPKAYRQGKSKEERATRVCWRIIHGPIAEGLHILHTCDNPPCVNYHHLWAGSIDDNQKDSMRKGRRPSGDRHGLHLHPEAIAKGERAHSAILTDNDIPRIRELGRAGLSQTAIGARYGVTKSTIGCVLRGETWRHIP